MRREIKQAGSVAFAIWAKKVTETFNALGIPDLTPKNWDQLPEDSKQAWCEIAKAVEECLDSFR